MAAGAASAVMSRDRASLQTSISKEALHPLTPNPSPMGEGSRSTGIFPGPAYPPEHPSCRPLSANKNELQAACHLTACCRGEICSALA